MTGTPSGHCPRCGFVPPEARPGLDTNPREPWSLLAVLVVLGVLLIVALAR